MPGEADRTAAARIAALEKAAKIAALDAFLEGGPRAVVELYEGRIRQAQEVIAARAYPPERQAKILAARRRGACKRFELARSGGQVIACVLWEGQLYITGTDIIKIITYRVCLEEDLRAIPAALVKKFEEGIFSDLRYLKSSAGGRGGARLEEAKSDFIEWLFKHGCIRTQKKQKVYLWEAVSFGDLAEDAHYRLVRLFRGATASSDSLNALAASTGSLTEAQKDDEDAVVESFAVKGSAARPFAPPAWRLLGEEQGASSGHAELPVAKVCAGATRAGSLDPFLSGGRGGAEGLDEEDALLPGEAYGNASECAPFSLDGPCGDEGEKGGEPFRRGGGGHASDDCLWLDHSIEMAAQEAPALPCKQTPRYLHGKGADAAWSYAEWGLVESFTVGGGPLGVPAAFGCGASAPLAAIMPPSAPSGSREGLSLGGVLSYGEEDRRFACSHGKCRRRFRRLEHLKRHLRIHTGERPFACAVPGCNKSFSRSDNLAQHHKVHDAEPDGDYDAVGQGGASPPPLFEEGQAAMYDMLLADCSPFT